MEASQQGFALENLIHTALSSIPVFQCLREQDIRTKFSDQSINGVDHWITFGTEHILIQDKWKESAATQSEMSQFLTCVERIQARCPSTDTFYLLWAGKLLPSSHAMASLKERNGTVLNCPISIEALSRLVVLEVCETFGVEPNAALLQIPVAKRGCTATLPSKREVVVTPNIAYDDTEEGKAAKANIEEMIRQIQMGPFRKVNNAQANSCVPDIWRLYSAAFPQDIARWTDGTIKKIDYSAFLRTMKGVCYPTKSKRLVSQSFCFYCKLRFISIELSSLAAQYNSVRETMLGKKSQWARKLPTLKCVAEPMTDGEYRGQIVHCDDYWMNTMGPGGTIVKRSSGIENQFYQHYQVY
jgi:hypothetical protein